MRLPIALCLASISCLIVSSLAAPAPDDNKGLFDTVKDTVKKFANDQLTASSKGACSTGDSTGGLTRDTCERESYLTYCDKTYLAERTCRYKPWAWAVFIGVPVLAVLLLSAVIWFTCRQRRQNV